MAATKPSQFPIDRLAPAKVSKSWLGVGTFLVLDFEKNPAGLRSIWLEFSDWWISGSGVPVEDSQFSSRAAAERAIAAMSGEELTSVSMDDGAFVFTLGSTTITTKPQVEPELVGPDDDAISVFFSEGAYSFRYLNGWRFEATRLS